MSARERVRVVVESLANPATVSEIADASDVAWATADSELDRLQADSRVREMSVDGSVKFTPNPARQFVDEVLALIENHDRGNSNPGSSSTGRGSRTSRVDTPDAEVDRLDAVLETKEVYDVTPVIARKAGRIAGRLTKDGDALNDPGDEMIGATGVVHDEPVLTKNVGHFDRIPGLRVETY